jgi:hypothetical protein
MEFMPAVPGWGNAMTKVEVLHSATAASRRSYSMKLALLRLLCVILTISFSLPLQAQSVIFQGLITTVAGNGIGGFSGDNGPATSAEVTYPFDVARDGAGNLYIADSANSRIRKVTREGIITTVAGGGTGCAGQINSIGDGCPATSAEFDFERL